MRAALAAAGIALYGDAAFAQDVPDLRGAVLESTVTDDLLGGEPLQPALLPDAFTDDPVPEPEPRPQGRVAANAQDDLATGTVRTPRVDALVEGNGRILPENQRAEAIEGLDRRQQEDPYAPLGLRLGTFIVTSRLDQGIGWTSNASESPAGDDAVFSETGLRLEAISDWSRHSAALRADGSYRRSISGDEIDELEGGVEGEFRFDLGHDIDASAGFGYRVRPESATSPSAIADVTERPLRHTFSGTAGVSREVGLIHARLSGDVVRDIYGDADLSDGTVVSQGDRDSTLATATLRLGYEISPALRPFIEGEGGRRFYDEELDGAGYARSADRYSVRVGVELDLREKLTGEFAAGWLTERPDDGRLEDISGFVTQGNLAWSPVRGTTVELSGSTEVEGATVAGETGSLFYSGNLALNRQLRADLTGRALIGIDWRDYAGSGAHDMILRGEASLTWWMNRYAGITGRARHELQRSSLAGRDYDATSIYLGMTLQR